MGKRTSEYTATSEADFPTSLPPYGTWFVGDGAFTLQKSLAAVKGAISSRATNSFEATSAWFRTSGGPVKFQQDVKVYELHHDVWHLIYEMRKGDERDSHELWKAPAPTVPQAVTDDEVDAAIQSILGPN